MCAPVVVVVGICGVSTLVSHTIRVIRSLVFSIFVGEVTWYNWTVRMGESVCVGRLVRAPEFEPSVFVVVGYHGSGD